MEQSTSLRKIATAFNASKSAVHRILNEHKFYPYVIQLVQGLNEGYFGSRLQFCEYLRDKLHHKHSFYSNGEVKNTFADTSITQRVGWYIGRLFYQ